MRRLLYVTTAAIALAATACSRSETVREPGAAVSIRIADYRYTPQNVSVRRGQVYFAVRNAGSEPTNFEIFRGERRRGRILTLFPGEVGIMILRLGPGIYTMASGTGKHEELGEHGTLTVRQGRGATGTP